MFTHTIDLLVFVGGAAAGRRLAVTPEINIIRLDVGDEHPVYVRESFHGERAVYVFWRWEGMKPDDALVAVFETYPAEKAAPLIRRPA